jgi:hypothetical protein
MIHGRARTSTVVVAMLFLLSTPDISMAGRFAGISGGSLECRLHGREYSIAVPDSFTVPGVRQTRASRLRRPPSLVMLSRLRR